MSILRVKKVIFWSFFKLFRKFLSIVFDLKDLLFVIFLDPNVDKLVRKPKLSVGINVSRQNISH